MVSFLSCSHKVSCRTAWLDVRNVILRMFACLSSVCLCSYRLNLRYTSRQNMRYINDLYLICVYSYGQASLGDLQKFRN